MQHYLRDIMFSCFDNNTGVWQTDRQPTMAYAALAVLRSKYRWSNFLQAQNEECKSTTGSAKQWPQLRKIHIESSLIF